MVKKKKKNQENKTQTKTSELLLFVFLVAFFLEFPVSLPSRLVFSRPEKHCPAASYEFLLLPLPPPLIPYSHSWVSLCVEWTISAINSLERYMGSKFFRPFISKDVCILYLASEEF